MSPPLKCEVEDVAELQLQESSSADWHTHTEHNARSEDLFCVHCFVWIVFI